MVQPFSLLTAAVLSIISVTATYIVSYQGNILDLAYFEASDFSVVNAHPIDSPREPNQKWVLIPSGNATIIQNVFSGTYLSSGPPTRLEYSQLVIHGKKPTLLSVKPFDNSRNFILDTSGTFALTTWPPIAGLSSPPVTFEKLQSTTSPLNNQLWTFKEVLLADSLVEVETNCEQHHFQG